jgi:Protein of unknown function (DUF4238)
MGEKANAYSNQHYVPKALLSGWTMQRGNQVKMLGHYWNPWKQAVWIRELGMRGFASEEDLWTLSSGTSDPYQIEKEIFGPIDDKAAKALKLVIGGGADSLDATGRDDFARLLLSLEVRQPEVIEHLKVNGADFLKRSLDADPTILATLHKAGILDKPSHWLVKQDGKLWEDRALELLSRLTKSRRVKDVMLRSTWLTIHRQDGDRLVLADRPLLRWKAYEDPDVVWMLPLSPDVLFVAASASRMKGISQEDPRRIFKAVNGASADQSVRYVFGAEPINEAKWLRKRLQMNHLYPKPRFAQSAGPGELGDPK